jgi:hypothetical protein
MSSFIELLKNLGDLAEVVYKPKSLL